MAADCAAEINFSSSGPDGEVFKFGFKKGSGDKSMIVYADVEGVDFWTGLGEGGIEEETVSRHEYDHFVALIL